MKKLLLLILSMSLFIGCGDKKVENEIIAGTVEKDGTAIYSPTFAQDYSKGCTSGAPVIGNDEIDFNAGRVRSIKGYKNISKISATVDISGLKDLRGVNAAFYMVKSQDDYCDSGDGCSECCDEIDFLETNGDVATQSTIHINKIQNYQYAFLGSLSSNVCWDQSKASGTGIVDASVIDPSLPFDIITEFNSDYTNMTVTYVQDSNSVVVYDFKNNAAGEGSKLVSLDGLKEDMENGWKIVASYWQGYSPDPNGAYRYDDASCKEWSDLCQGSFKISTIRVTAEDTI